MVITSLPGPDWATIMTAFGTVGAVIAAVGIAIWSGRTTNTRVAAERTEADRRLREQLDHSDQQLAQERAAADERLREQLDHSDEQLRLQQEHSDQQLAQERAAADERLRKQFAQAEQLEQRGEAAAVMVIGARMPAGEGVVSEPRDPAERPVIIVINNGKYAITSIAVRLSPDGRSVVGLGKRETLRDLSVLPQPWTSDLIGMLGDVYLGTITPGAAMQFVGDPLLSTVLRTSYPIVRWIDRWDECWEHKQGQTYPTDRNAEWRP